MKWWGSVKSSVIPAQQAFPTYEATWVEERKMGRINIKKVNKKNWEENKIIIKTKIEGWMSYMTSKRKKLNTGDSVRLWNQIWVTFWPILTCRQMARLTLQPKAVLTARGCSPTSLKSLQKDCVRATRGLSSATTTHERTRVRSIPRAWERHKNTVK